MDTLPHAHRRAVSVRIGHPSGRRNYGCSRASRSRSRSERCTLTECSARSRPGGAKQAMANARDVILIGAGHNGLITAFYLARAGLRPLVLERREQVGGAAITQEFYPGFRGSLLAHSAGPLRPEIMRDMQLESWGLKWIV